jgi:trk system potassium uptake protein TrkH
MRIVGSYLYVLAFLLAVGGLVSAYYQFCVPPRLHPQPHATHAFLQTFVLCFISAAALRYASRESGSGLELKEAIVAVAAIWVVSIFFASLPFLLSGSLEHPIDACFEVVSGLTTTGASILHPKAYDASGHEIPITQTFYGFQKIEYSFFGTVKPVLNEKGRAILIGTEAFSKGLLFWRAFLNWIGGLGVVFLFVALLPALGQKGRTLFRYESTGPAFSPLFPQVRKTALVLFAVYTILTLLCIGSYLAVDPAMDVLDAVCTAFSALATGGFSLKNASIAGYSSFGVEVVSMVFMVVGAINFALFYELWRGRIYKLFQVELLSFLGLILLIGSIVSWDIIGAKKFTLTDIGQVGVYNIGEAFRYGFFQIITAITTTGFVTIDYDKWPFLAQTFMLVVMFLGGMAGSTAGGLKIIRVCILFQCFRHAISSVFKRSEMRIMRVGDREIDSETAFGVLAFFLIFMATSLAGILVLVFFGVDPETSLGLCGCMINNVGCAFRMAGPTSSCAFLGVVPKSMCIIWMLLGRIEFYVWFALFLPSFWRRG